MTSMFLLSISHDKTHKTPPVEKNLGYIDTFGSTKRLILKSQGNTIYRLIDEKTGQVIKNQILLVSGKKLQVPLYGMRGTQSLTVLTSSKTSAHGMEQQAISWILKIC